MREIVTRQQADTLLLWMAILGPLAGAAAGAALALRNRRSAQGAVRGLAIGLSGPLLFGMWRVYNAITDRLGLDTVRNLLVNLALFVVVGAAGGVLFGVFSGRRRATEEGDAAEISAGSSVEEKPNAR